MALNFTLAKDYQFLSRFYQLTITNILSCIIVPLAGFISVVFLGHLADINQLAGVSLGSILFDYMYFCLNFLRLVTTGMTAIAIGQNARKDMVLVGIRNCLIALGLGILILFLHNPLGNLGFALLSATPEVKSAGLDYFNARIWGAPAVLLNYVIVGWFLGQEKGGRVLLMTVVFNVANILQDYLYIIRWDWSSTGAGISAGVSQYLMLLTGLFFMYREISFKDIREFISQSWNLSSFQYTFALNGNFFIRSLIIAFTYAIFSSLSATMGTLVLAENALLLQVVLLTIDIFYGIGLTTTALTGIFKGEKAEHKYLPLLQVSVGTSFLVGFTCATVCILFPQTIFRLLTNHNEVIELVKVYVPWLLLVLGPASISLILEGYFTGLAEGNTLRNTFLISLIFGFIPLALLTWYYHINHFLWLAMSMFMLIRMVVLGIQLPRTFGSNIISVSSNN